MFFIHPLENVQKIFHTYALVWAYMRLFILYMLRLKTCISIELSFKTEAASARIQLFFWIVNFLKR